MTFRKRRSVRNQHACLARLAAAIEPLERRLLLTSVVVSTIADSTNAPGSTIVSLRDAITVANNSTTPTTIYFNLTPFATAQTITLGGKDLEISAKQPVTIDGPAAGVTVNGNLGSGVFTIDKGSTATITGLTITGGEDDNGGGILNNGSLTLNSSTVTHNIDVSEGGGIANYGTLFVNTSTISNNGADTGGGIENNPGATMTLTDVTLSGNYAQGSGGIDNGGTAALNRVSVSNNTATGEAGPGGSSPGSEAGIGNEGAMTLIDCTVVGNSDKDSAGGIGNFGTLTLADSTVAGNQAGGGYGGASASQTEVVGSGAGLYIDPSSTSTVIKNSIIAGNQIAHGTGPDVSGAASSSGYNLIGQTNGSTGWKSTDLTGTTASPLNPDLGPLANNGGPTQTEILLAGSPAIGAGSVGLIPAGITSDQRGLARVVNGKVDIGAVELQANATITGTVFDDANSDGSQDNGEPGLGGVQVYLDLGNVGYYVTGDPTTMTSAFGGYTLSGLIPNNYIVRQVLPSSFSQTTPGNGYGHHVTVTSGQTISGQNFGDKTTATTPTATVDGVIYDDVDGVGMEIPHDNGIGYVQIYDDLGNVGHYVAGDPTVMANAGGGFVLSGLPAGNNIIRQVIPAGYKQTQPSGGLGYHLTLVPGAEVSNVNFGDQAIATPSAAITGTVFNDANGDGIEDNGETGIANVEVYLDLGNVGYFVNGDPTTMTDGLGDYTLSGLAAGNYIVRQVSPKGYVQTSPSNGYGHHVTVSAGRTLSGQSFGDKA